MTEVLDTVEAHTVENGDLIEYVTGRGQSRVMKVTADADDRTTYVLITGVSEDTGDKVTVRFQPDDLVDILGA